MLHLLCEVQFSFCIFNSGFILRSEIKNLRSHSLPSLNQVTVNLLILSPAGSIAPLRTACGESETKQQKKPSGTHQVWTFRSSCHSETCCLTGFSCWELLVLRRTDPPPSTLLPPASPASNALRRIYPKTLFTSITRDAVGLSCFFFFCFCFFLSGMEITAGDSAHVIIQLTHVAGRPARTRTRHYLGWLFVRSEW